MIYLISILLSSNKFNGDLIAFLLYIWKCCINPCGSDIIEQDYNKPNIRNFCLQTSSSSLCCCIALNYKLKFKWDKTQVCGTKKFSPLSHVVQSILVYQIPFSEHTLTFNSINRSFYFLLYFAQQHFLPKHKNVVSRGIFKWLNVYNLNKPSGNKSVFISIILNMYDATNMAQNFAKIAMLRRSILQNDYSETHNSASQNNDRI